MVSKDCNPVNKCVKIRPLDTNGYGSNSFLKLKMQGYDCILIKIDLLTKRTQVDFRTAAKQPKHSFHKDMLI